MTRRELLLAPAALAAAGKDGIVLENGAFRYEAGARHRRFENKRANETVSLPPEEFVLEFQDGATIRSGDLARKRISGAELLFTGSVGVEVRVRYSAHRTYLRKQIAVRGADRRLMRADLENWRGVRRNWDSMHADRQPYASHPVFSPSLWAGVEFVAAFNEYGSNGFILRSRPGGLRIGPAWSSLHSTVIGTAEPNGVRDAFLEYIDDVRLAAPRWVACYNSWWTLPLRPKHAEVLALAEDLKRALYGRHGVFFDLFTVDEGWTDPHSIWEIDREALPNGFRELRGIVEAAGGKLGLWMSPSAMYPRSTDYEWAARKGFAVIGGARRAVSLADPNYREKTKDALRRLIRGSGLAHIKYDGFTAIEEAPHHDLLPGADSVEPLAAHSLELIAASKEANPGLMTEPTYLNSLVNYISPWIIKYADTVWGNSGGDCPQGLGPAPDYRESATNAREYYIFQSLNEVWLPQNALQYFDIVHCDASGGFPNHAAMAVGRGRFFLSSYINPKFMTEEDWRVYAGLLRWARANTDILRHTRVLASRVESGEPYCYAHWLDGRGILAVRNPSNESRTYSLELPSRDVVVYTQYPYRKGLAAGGGKITVPLAPWELLFIEAAPRPLLREPVAFGGRWYAGADGRMRVAPDPGVKQVRVLQPGGAEAKFDVAPRPGERAAGTLEGFSRRGASFEVECSVSIPRSAASAMLLLLVEFPGLKHFPSQCAATVNGRPAGLEARHSEGHIALRRRMPYATEWTWYLCPVGPGTFKVAFSGKGSAPDFKVGVWLWADSDCAANEVPLPVACGLPEMPEYRDRRAREGVCLKEKS